MIEARREACVQGLGLVASTGSTPLLSLPLQCHLQRATTWPPFSSFEGLEGELGSSRTGGSEGDPSGLQNCRQGWRMLRAGGGDTEGATTLGGGGEGSRLHRDSVQAAPGPLQLEDQSDHLTSEAWDFQTPGPPEENRRAWSHIYGKQPGGLNPQITTNCGMKPCTRFHRTTSPVHAGSRANHFTLLLGAQHHAAPGAGPEGSARDGGCGNPEAVNQSLLEETQDLTSGPVSDTGAPAELGALAGGPISSASRTSVTTRLRATRAAAPPASRAVGSATGF